MKKNPNWPNYYKIAYWTKKSSTDWFLNVSNPDAQTFFNAKNIGYSKLGMTKHLIHITVLKQILPTDARLIKISYPILHIILLVSKLSWSFVFLYWRKQKTEKKIKEKIYYTLVFVLHNSISLQPYFSSPTEELYHKSVNINVSSSL